MKTDAELARACISRADYRKRNEKWQQFLSEIEPDERERIRANPTGPEAIALAIRIEIAIRNEQP